MTGYVLGRIHNGRMEYVQQINSPTWITFHVDIQNAWRFETLEQAKTAALQDLRRFTFFIQSLNGVSATRLKKCDDPTPSSPFTATPEEPRMIDSKWCILKIIDDKVLYLTCRDHIVGFTDDPRNIMAFDAAKEAEQYIDQRMPSKLGVAVARFAVASKEERLEALRMTYNDLLGLYRTDIEASKQNTGMSQNAGALAVKLDQTWREILTVAKEP